MPSSYDMRRESSCKRGYGRTWEKLRKLILHRDPLCTLRKNVLAFVIEHPLIPSPLRRDITAAADLLCTGTGLSAHVDHFVPKPIGDNSEENLGGACASCHSIKTNLLDSLILKALAYVGRGGRFSAFASAADRVAGRARVAAK